MRSSVCGFRFCSSQCFFPELQVGNLHLYKVSRRPHQRKRCAQNPGSVMISLDDAIQMALRHNHNILAARTTIQQSEAEETTANLRPNPVLLSDWQFFRSSSLANSARITRQRCPVRLGRELFV